MAKVPPAATLAHPGHSFWAYFSSDLIPPLQFPGLSYLISLSSLSSSPFPLSPSTFLFLFSLRSTEVFRTLNFSQKDMADTFNIWNFEVSSSVSILSICAGMSYFVPVPLYAAALPHTTLHKPSASWMALLLILSLSTMLQFCVEPFFCALDPMVEPCSLVSLYTEYAAVLDLLPTHSGQLLPWHCCRKAKDWKQSKALQQRPHLWQRRYIRMFIEAAQVLQLLHRVLPCRMFRKLLLNHKVSGLFFWWELLWGVLLPRTIKVLDPFKWRYGCN